MNSQFPQAILSHQEVVLKAQIKIVTRLEEDKKR